MLSREYTAGADHADLELRCWRMIQEWTNGFESLPNFRGHLVIELASDGLLQICLGAFCCGWFHNFHTRLLA
jgi:hypothetical protein